MKLKIEAEHYGFTVEVNNRLALGQLVSGWWEITDGRGNQLMPRFRRKNLLGAAIHVAKWIQEYNEL